MHDPSIHTNSDPHFKTDKNTCKVCICICKVYTRIEHSARKNHGTKVAISVNTLRFAGISCYSPLTVYEEEKTRNFLYVVSEEGYGGRGKTALTGE